MSDIKFNAMDPEMAFAGLTSEAREFIEKEGKWDPCPPHVLEKVGSPAYLLAMRDKSALYTLIIQDDKLTVANIGGRILNTDNPDSMLIFLLKYTLKDGTMAEAYKQGEKEGILYLALRIGDEDKFKWTEEDLDAVLKKLEES